MGKEDSLVEKKEKYFYKKLATYFQTKNDRVFDNVVWKLKWFLVGQMPIRRKVTMLHFCFTGGIKNRQSKTSLWLAWTQCQ